MRRGVSLLEIIFSLFLLGLIIVMVANLYPSTLGSVRYSGQRLEANALASSLIEKEMARPFTQLVAGPPQTLPVVPGKGAVYTPTVEIFAVNEPGVKPGLLIGIRARVDWVDHSIPHSIVREVTRVKAPPS